MKDSKRRICYITGTRADFGLMQSTLVRIQKSEALELSMVVTGTHLSAEHGSTVEEIISAGLLVSEMVRLNLTDSTGAAMARNIGVMISSFVDAFEKIRPDVVLLLGDRGEMLAGALAAIHLNIPVAHIHGGERSGTVDEPVRHAISKLSHIHFVATDDSRDRLIRMGEHASSVFVTGAPGLDGLSELITSTKASLCEEVGFDPRLRTALFVFHSVLQEADRAGTHATNVMEALVGHGLQIIALMPNSDAGSESVRHALRQFEHHEKIRLLIHLPRGKFISWMAACDVMVGNSSSGIIEAATFGTPVINIGIRQNLRQRNVNVVDVEPETATVQKAVNTALQHGRFSLENFYGDGRAGERIAGYLAKLPLTPELLLKFNAY
ncbi:MAG: UDP-N-acetyl-D-glucosamine 2-epimerase, UDP-hydrolysing [Burkholderiales bacterium RIFCSPLOWO2_02_FULL_57_36]|nr:MAG: UDP-N-acetyl-D-glucosamine 2-epimerase, UDP-hydrolysing [Burkholderiales bacterium RIFCSPLOWO2_02_FULL_57_36]